jgi:prepilin-type N-terminal cleavage/methylation domain-containing protein
MRQDGVTLIELLVVVAISGILVIALGFGFVGWMARYNVENQIKTMQADLMNARQRAMERGIQYVTHLEANKISYVICEDEGISPDSLCDAIETDRPISRSLSKNGLRYPLDWRLDLGTAPNPPADTIVMDKRGVLPCTDPNATCTGIIFMKNPDTGVPYRPEDVDYDCIVLSAVKINVGKYDATTNNCNAK